MESSTAIDRVRALFKKTDAEVQDYEPIDEDEDFQEGGFDDDVRRPILILPETDGGQTFSWLEYCVFLLMGVAMLWAW